MPTYCSAQATYQISALFTIWGDEKGKEFLSDLKANDVRIARSHAEVKGLVVGGEVAFGLLDTDDAAEALKEQSNLEIVYPDQKDLGTLVIPSTLALLRGGPNTEGGKKLIDFLLSKKDRATNGGIRGLYSTPIWNSRTAQYSEDRGFQNDDNQLLQGSR